MQAYIVLVSNEVRNDDAKMRITERDILSLSIIASSTNNNKIVEKFYDFTDANLC